MAAVLEVRGLAASYGERAIFSDLTFDVAEGDVLAVVGPNGSGKTTLLRAMLGMMKPSYGSVSFLGRPLSGYGSELESMISYIPQRMDIDRTFPISLSEFLSLGPRRPQMEKYLDILDLRGLMDSRVGALSGGQMQRALLALAVLKGPRLLVMDEPTSWVDVRGADCIVCIMEEFKRQGIAMITVTHDYASIRGVASHVLGLGMEGHHFFGSAGDADLDSHVVGVFGSSHHGDSHVHGLHCSFRVGLRVREGAKNG